MALFRWGSQTWDPFRDLEREVDQLLEGVTLGFQGLRVNRQYPPINVYEHENQLMLVAELAGIRPEELEVTIADGVLTLKGRHAGPTGVPDDKYRRQERVRGSWQRVLTLPDRIIEDELTAEFVNGILIVRLPRAMATPARQIPIASGEVAPPPPMMSVITEKPGDSP